jgi:CRISPR-associated protein Cmr5
MNELKAQSAQPTFSRDQKWAQLASILVRSRENEAWCADYGRQCLHLPVMIHQCGLCQTLAFLEQKASAKRPWFQSLLDDLASAMGNSSTASLSDQARSLPITEYQRLSRNALGCANYLKRYAEAFLKVEPGADDAAEGGT